MLNNPAMKEGTERIFTADEFDAGNRLDVFLAERSGLSRSRIKALINKNCVDSDDGKPIKPSHIIETGDSITLSLPPAEYPVFVPEDIPLDIVYQDTHIIVVNKPAGMIVHPARGHFHGSLVSALLFHCSSSRKRGLEGVGDPLKPGIVHRIDMDTTGLLVVALTGEAFDALSQMVRDHTIQRHYTAYVWGHSEPLSGTINAPIGRHPKNRVLKAVVKDGRPSVTHYETSALYEYISKLDITLETGRTHQIRVHMASIGHHIFGDPFYGGRDKRLKGFDPVIRDRARYLLKKIHRQSLHAARLVFNHPITGESLSFEAPLPEDLSWLHKQLENAPRGCL